VYREADGFWTFTCGKGDHVKKEDVVPVCKDCALDENNLAGDLANLQPGHEATREDANSAWHVRPSDPSR